MLLKQREKLPMQRKAPKRKKNLSQQTSSIFLDFEHSSIRLHLKNIAAKKIQRVLIFVPQRNSFSLRQILDLLRPIRNATKDLAGRPLNLDIEAGQEAFPIFPLSGLGFQFLHESKHRGILGFCCRAVIQVWTASSHLFRSMAILQTHAEQCPFLDSSGA